MQFLVRAMIGILSGVGAGAVGFYLSWRLLWALTGEHPGIGYDPVLVVSIFAPGVLAALAVFWYLARRLERKAT